MSEPRVFPCERCGACCRAVTPEMAKLAGLPVAESGRGCAHQAGDDLCEIYSTRPALCRVVEMFPLAHERLGLEWQDYAYRNKAACQMLREREALA